MFSRGLKPLSVASVVLIVGAFALVFFYAPNDADQGFIQKIFYLHVPLAIVALCGFVAGIVSAARMRTTFTTPGKLWRFNARSNIAPSRSVLYDTTEITALLFCRIASSASASRDTPP